MVQVVGKTVSERIFTIVGDEEIVRDESFQALRASHEEMLAAYVTLHGLGHAHSVEAWRDGELAGGLYGVALGGAFFGESMFSRVRDASKVVLVHLAARLRMGGFRLLDVQFITDHLRQFGAVEIPAMTYLEMLDDALKVQGDFYFDAAPSDVEAALEELFLQSNTQTS